jgi:hypothetical protein
MTNVKTAFAALLLGICAIVPAYAFREPENCSELNYDVSHIVGHPLDGEEVIADHYARIWSLMPYSQAKNVWYSTIAYCKEHPDISSLSAAVNAVVLSVPALLRGRKRPAVGHYYEDLPVTTVDTNQGGQACTRPCINPGPDGCTFEDHFVHWGVCSYTQWELDLAYPQ